MTKFCSITFSSIKFRSRLHYSRVLSFLTAFLTSVFLFNTSSSWANNNYRLPTLGDSSSSLVSPQQEYLLGRAWLSAYRSRVPTHSDPLVQDYLEKLTQRLAIHSELSHLNLELVVVKNPSINAFAVPGGVIGVHTGLLTEAKDEHQLASVLGHELAHLSQRHYARGLQSAKANALPTLAGLLASLVLAATAGADAGMAAITATQAAALNQQLRFSRQNEKEADRIGLQTLYHAGFDPHGASRMFEQMQKAVRFTGQRPPEFLLTHPITESRISDTRQRADKYTVKHYEHSMYYQLIRARTIISHSNNSQQAVKYFQSELESGKMPEIAARYGLTVALIKAKRWQEAGQALNPLLQSPDSAIVLPFILAKAEIHTGQKQYAEALKLLHALYKEIPNNYPLALSLSQVYEKQHAFEKAENILKQQSRLRPADPIIWYHLAEIRGLEGDILGVHQARAEYFLLNGLFSKARKQLNYALKLVENNPRDKAIIENRQKQIGQLKQQLEQLK